MAEEPTINSQGTQAQFAQTRWTEVLAAAKEESPNAQDALERLCKRYWYPIYAFLRHQGHKPEDAKDLTQGFLAHLLAKDRLSQVHPAKGKFRSFLLACLGNYVQNVRDKEQAAKRGGGQQAISIDDLAAENKYCAEPASLDDPAKIFERRWAKTLLEGVLQHLKEQYERESQGEIFDAMAPFLVGDSGRGDYAAVAARLRISEGNARVKACRLREDYRALLYREVAETVDDYAEIEGEIRNLMAAFQGS